MRRFSVSRGGNHGEIRIESGLLLRLGRLCREALVGGADMNKLFTIPVREQIGRAKSVPAEEYKEVYAKISESMKYQIEEIAAGGEDE